MTPSSAGGPAGPGLQAVLFDMDGLLVDSEPLWFQVERAVMARLGGEWAAQDQQALLGGSLARTVSYLLAKAQAGGRPASALPPRQDVARWLLDGMTRLMAESGLPVCPGARELRDAVAAAGVPCALVTSSQRAIMQTALRVTGMSFPVTVCAEDVGRGKPHPEPYLRAAALLGVEPRGCVVLEDSPSGIAAGQAAGCAVIAVPSVPLTGGERPQAVIRESLAGVTVAMLRSVAASHQRRAPAGPGPAGRPAAQATP